jgi:hypothetical protein
LGFAFKQNRRQEVGGDKWSNTAMAWKLLKLGDR